MASLLHVRYDAAVAHEKKSGACGVFSFSMAMTRLAPLFLCAWNRFPFVARAGAPKGRAPREHGALAGEAHCRVYGNRYSQTI